ncbi:MAG: FAD-dependent oxidoreductase [Elusimicrobiales bacterium]|nr:FAD-dependent oxidoreductase [Elusimicrobiales bacterium]
MIVKKYRSEVVSVENPVADIRTVTLRPLEKAYKYNPGQFLHLALDEYDPAGPWPESRCFSMQSSPDDETIKITFAAKGKFTARMAVELAPGKVIHVKLPYGDLFQEGQDGKKSVFVAGGTGITPFLSLFTSKTFAAYPEPRLYFGVRNPSHQLYAANLEKARAVNPSFSFKVLNEEKDGRLDIKTILKENGPAAVYFISGPPVMIKNFKSSLAADGVPAENIRTDDWE